MEGTPGVPHLPDRSQSLCAEDGKAAPYWSADPEIFSGESFNRLFCPGDGRERKDGSGITGAGKGEQGAMATARICNQVHPQRIGANMLTIYQNSEL